MVAKDLTSNEIETVETTINNKQLGWITANSQQPNMYVM